MIEHMFDTTTREFDTPTPSGYYENGWWEDTSPDGWEPNEIRSASIPPDLELIPAGADLAVVLDRIDRTRICGYDLVRVLKARERLASHVQAEVARDMEELSRVDPDDGLGSNRTDDPWEYAADEVRAALCLTRNAAKTRLAFAQTLVNRFPQVLAELSDGSIDWHRARVIAEGVSHLDPETATKVVDEVVVRAPEMTTGQIRAWIRRLCIDVDPDRAAERYERAVEARQLFFFPTDNGTVDLLATNLPADRANAIGNRINRMLKALRRDGDTRTADQTRVDILLDLLDSGGEGGRGAVNIAVDLATLAGLNDKAAEIPGYGPVIADIARRIAATQLDSPWNIVVTDQGRPVATGTTRYRPTNGMTRLIHAMYPTCTHPGCRMPAADCDIDHIVAREDGGPTEIENLGPGCRHDHGLKHQGGWTYRRVGDEHHWTSPLGHTYVTTGRSP